MNIFDEGFEPEVSAKFSIRLRNNSEEAKGTKAPVLKGYILLNKHQLEALSKLAAESEDGSVFLDVALWSNQEDEQHKYPLSGNVSTRKTYTRTIAEHEKPISTEKSKWY